MTAETHSETTQFAGGANNSDDAELRKLVLLLVLATTAIFCILTIEPGMFGFYDADAMYLTTAKPLATGQGYRIVRLSDERTQTHKGS